MALIKLICPESGRCSYINTRRCNRPVTLYIEKYMPPRGPLAKMSTLAAEGQRQHITRWYGLGGEESSSTAIIQALLPDGETMPSRRHNQTDSESGKEANEANTEEVPVSPSFFFGLVGRFSIDSLD